jgi:hypothetical protein
MSVPTAKPATRRIWLAAAVLLLLAAISYPLTTRLQSRAFTRAAAAPSGTTSLAADESDNPHPLRLRTAKRQLNNHPPATHGAHQLWQFVLPAMDFEGIPLSEALAKLRNTYADTCRKTGENPLDISFVLPTNKNPILRVKITGGTLEGSMHLLASMAKLSVQRKGREFLFSAPAEQPGRHFNETLPVPQDIARLLGASADDPRALRDILADSGLLLDPTTRLTRGPNGLEIETDSAADLAAFGSLAQSGTLSPRFHQTTSNKLITLPAGAAWDPADELNVDDINPLMRRLRQTKGVDVMTLPSSVSTPDTPGTIEITRDFAIPSATADSGWENVPVGVVVKSTANPLGLGQQVQSSLSITSGEIDKITGQPRINSIADATAQYFTKDGNTEIGVQELPDGSRLIWMSTITRIDATGIPVNPRE